MKKLIPETWPDGTKVDESWAADSEAGHIAMIAQQQLLNNTYEFIRNQLQELPAEYHESTAIKLQEDFRSWAVLAVSEVEL